MKIVLLGSPGVGKGTYASKLKKIYNIPHISTGDLFRDHIKNNTPLGEQAQSFMDKGLFVPDEITVAMVKERLEKDDAQKGYLLDGFPRTIAQAESTETFVGVDTVLNFVADESVILRRLTGRRICKQCGAIYNLLSIIPKVEGHCDECEGELYQRADEKEDVIKERLLLYYEKTQPLVNYYKDRGTLVEVDATLDVNHPDYRVIKVCQEILSRL